MIPLSALLSSRSEDQISKILNSFSCQRNLDIEKFLKTSAIAFERSNRSRTYLIFVRDSDGGHLNILGYFTIAIHLVDVSSTLLSGNLRKRLVRMFYSPARASHHVPCFLIGQLGKDDRSCETIEGREIISYALDALKTAHQKVAGRFIKVDCEDSEGLIRFYRENGFTPIQKNPGSGMIEMVMFFGKGEVPPVEG